MKGSGSSHNGMFNDPRLVRAVGFPPELEAMGYRPVGMIDFEGGQECTIYKCLPRRGLIGPRDREGRAVQITDANPVAIKILDQRAGSWAHSVIASEGMALENIDARNVPWLYERGALDTPPHRPYLVQDYVHGYNLHDVIRTRKAGLAEYNGPGGGLLFNEIEWVELARRLFDTLAQVHQFGYIHLDIKPSNIMLHALTREPWLVDFGLARHTGRARRDVVPLAGSVPFAAPETIGKSDVSRAADVFAACMTLAEALVGVNLRDPDGKAAGEAKSIGQSDNARSIAYLMRFHLTHRPQLERLPEWARRVLEPGLSADLAERPSDGAEMLARLEDVFPPSRKGADTPDKTLPYRSKPFGAVPGGSSLDPLNATTVIPGPIDYVVPVSKPRGMREWGKKELLYLGYDIDYGHFRSAFVLLGYGLSSGVVTGILILMVLQFAFGPL